MLEHMKTYELKKDREEYCRKFVARAIDDKFSARLEVDEKLETLFNLCLEYLGKQNKAPYVQHQIWSRIERHNMDG